MGEENIIDLCDSATEQVEPNMCRLCSVEGALTDLFIPSYANMKMRILILLATGIEIKQNDIVSRKVCQRCCGIAVKLHKYRTNAVANDKLLKEQSGLPYTPPITDQEELLRIASKITSEQNTCNGGAIMKDGSNSHSDALELFNITLKKEIISTPYNDDLGLDLAQSLSTPDSTKSVKNGDTSIDKCKRVPKVEYKHPSIHKLLKTHTGIILPEDVFKSDISPVISLDASEVSDWYAEQFNALKRKLKNIVFKEIPHSISSSSVVFKEMPRRSNHKISSSTIIFKEMPSKSNLTSPPVDTSKQHAENVARRGKVIFKEMPRRSSHTISSSPVDTFKQHAENLATHGAIIVKEMPLRSIHTISSSLVDTSQQHAEKLATHGAVTVTKPITVISKSSGVTSSEHSLTASTHSEAPPKHSEPPPKHSAATSSEHIAVTSSSKKRKATRSAQRIIDTSDSDEMDRDEFQPFTSNYDLEDDTPQADLATTNAPVASETTSTFKKGLHAAENQQVTAATNCVNSYKQSARKRTGRRSTTRRKRRLSQTSDINEIIPEKKKRDYNASTLCFPNIADLASQECLSDTTQQKTVITSPVELTSSEPPELVMGKTLEVYMCPICNKLYDTKKQLIDHEKTHLTCKFCKKRMRNIEMLHKHQNESCFINIVKNKPIIKLRKVDSVPSIVQQYAKAFKQSYIEKHTELTMELDCNGDVDCNESRPNIEEVVLPMPSENNFLSGEEAVSEDFITTNSISKSELVCISISDSDDEIECTEIPRHKIVSNPFTIPSNGSVVSLSKKSQHSTVDFTLGSQLTTTLIKQKAGNISEKELIRSLFKKHSYPPMKYENSSQTFAASNYNIKYTSTNLIILDNMFTELTAYKIPVHLEAHPRISARFKEEVSVPEPLGNLECWAFKKSIDVQKRNIAYTNRTSSNVLANNALVLNVMNTPAPRKLNNLLNSHSNLSESLYVKKPTILNGCSSNVTTTVANNMFSTSNAIPLTMALSPATNLHTATSTPGILAVNPTQHQFSNANQPTTFMQIMNPPNTVQYQAPVVSHGNRSIVLDEHQRGGNNHRTESVVHTCINNSVTNVSKFFLLANNLQQLPRDISNIRFETSYFNHPRPVPALSYEQSTGIREIEPTNQQLSVVTYNGNEQIQDNSNSRLRVKNISELN